jgi:hypothetical protein
MLGMAGHAAAHDSEQLPFRHRLGEQITLPDLTTDGLQLMTFMSRLDTFGNGLQPETFAELDNGLAETSIDAVVMAIRDIAAIDLELAEGELA